MKNSEALDFKLVVKCMRENSKINNNDEKKLKNGRHRYNGQIIHIGQIGEIKTHL